MNIALIFDCVFIFAITLTCMLLWDKVKKLESKIEEKERSND